MNKVVSKTLEIYCPVLPPTTDFIENKIKEFNIMPLRWSIVKISGFTLTLSVSGAII